jgi:hypothetical protein
VETKGASFKPAGAGSRGRRGTTYQAPGASTFRPIILNPIPEAGQGGGGRGRGVSRAVWGESGDGGGGGGDTVGGVSLSPRAADEAALLLQQRQKEQRQSQRLSGRIATGSLGSHNRCSLLCCCGRPHMPHMPEGAKSMAKGVKKGMKKGYANMRSVRG